MFRKECFVTGNLVFHYYQLTFNIIHVIRHSFQRRDILFCLRQSRNLVQSTAKAHHPQLFVRTKIYSSYSISVATSYSRSIQILTM